MILDSATSILVIVDIQQRLMPAIHDGEIVVANARRLAEGATLLDIPVVMTEQNPAGLGPSVAGLAASPLALVTKTTFDSCRAAGFLDSLPDTRPTTVLVGCEAHVCVLQTALGLVAAGRHVVLVRDAVGSRTAANRDAALARLSQAGVEMATTEMVLFEWLGSSDHPRFKSVLALIK